MTVIVEPTIVRNSHVTAAEDVRSELLAQLGLAQTRASYPKHIASPNILVSDAWENYDGGIFARAFAPSSLGAEADHPAWLRRSLTN